MLWLDRCPPKNGIQGSVSRNWLQWLRPGAGLFVPYQGPQDIQAVTSRLIHAPEEHQDVSEKVGNRDHAARTVFFGLEGKSMYVSFS